MIQRTVSRGIPGAIAVAAFCLVAAAILLPACSRGGRSSGTATSQTAGTTIPVSGAHVAIQLRDVNGTPINVNQAEAPPYSPKQTCGYCHNYHTIGEGYHFQQGWEFVDDDYGVANGTYPWNLSPGMLGKW
jgi:hypothetical protein